MKKARRKPGRPRVERVQHIVEITAWDWDYMFQVDQTTIRTEPYFDCRHLNISGRLIRPTSLLGTNVKVTCFPMQSLLESERKDNQPKAVGYISHRGKNYSSHLHMPSDVLGPILQMMIGEKYQFIFMEAEESFRGEAAVIGYRFSGTLDDDDLSSE